MKTESSAFWKTSNSLTLVSVFVCNKIICAAGVKMLLVTVSIKSHVWTTTKCFLYFLRPVEPNLQCMNRRDEILKAELTSHKFFNLKMLESDLPVHTAPVNLLAERVCEERCHNPSNTLIQ